MVLIGRESMNVLTVYAHPNPKSFCLVSDIRIAEDFSHRC